MSVLQRAVASIGYGSFHSSLVLNCDYVCNRKKVPAVPESLLKRRKAFATMKAIRIKKIVAEKKVMFH